MSKRRDWCGCSVRDNDKILHRCMEFTTITSNAGEVEFKVLSKDETNQLLESAKSDDDDDGPASGRFF